MNKVEEKKFTSNLLQADDSTNECICMYSENTKAYINILYLK